MVVVVKSHGGSSQGSVFVSNGFSYRFPFFLENSLSSGVSWEQRDSLFHTGLEVRGGPLASLLCRRQGEDLELKTRRVH